MGDAKITIPELKRKKSEGEKITVLTAYSYPQAAILDESGIDIILVGDSLAMVEKGLKSTVPVTMEEMISHGKAVRRAVNRALMVVDMPFMSYHVSPEDAVRNACRIFKETGCDAVKLEGGTEVLPQTKAILRCGIPVMGHLGLQPQTVSKLGGYRVQGRDLDSAKSIVDSARALSCEGVFSIVLECVPRELGGLVSTLIDACTIGIGGGRDCDGQVLVLHDILGMYDGFKPKFVKRYADIRGAIKKAVTDYSGDVRGGTFPGREQEFTMDPQTLDQLKKVI